MPKQQASVPHKRRQSGQPGFHFDHAYHCSWDVIIQAPLSYLNRYWSIGMDDYIPIRYVDVINYSCPKFSAGFGKLCL